MSTLFADIALLPDGWARNVRITLSTDGFIARVERDQAKTDADFLLDRRILLAAPANLHSHGFQKGLAGLTERRGAKGRDSFWTWRQLMYRFLEHLTPGHIEAITAQVQIETLEAGFASIGEFHYVHHQPDGKPYDSEAETSLRVIAAAKETGISLTLLPVLYMQGGVDGRPLDGGQLRFGCTVDQYCELKSHIDIALKDAPRDFVLGSAPHSLRAVPAALFDQADPLWADGPVHIHIAEQVKEVEDIREAYGTTPVNWLLGHADVDDRWCLVHSTHMSASEAARMARSGAVAGLCPLTEANLGDGIFQARAFLDAGGDFGIGSDSNICISVTEELRLLEYGQRLQGQTRAVIASEEKSCGRLLFDKICHDGARALGRRSGKIAEGLYADLLAIDGDAVSIAGLKGDQVLDGWIFADPRSIVTDVWSAGRHVVKDGRHIRRDSIEHRYRMVSAELRGLL